jgi:crotonobetainyl-CoA:carnitine CoA-transferase CaiB-like acyl-CoA transferase
VRAANAEEEQARRDIEAIIKTRDRDDWYEYLVKADVCVGKVYDPDEVVRDPQILHRQMIVEIDDPRHGPIKQFGTAIKLSETPGAIRSAGALPGAHTDEVLRELGYDAGAIHTLRDKGVV